jgi:hypothetical protein
MQVYIRRITKTIEERHEDCDCVQQFDEDIETRISHTHTQHSSVEYRTTSD